LNDATVVIDCFPASAVRYRNDHAIVAIDVIRATTLAITAVATGRRCLVATDLEDAAALKARLGDALLAGELGGYMPYGFEMNNSPADLMARDDFERPLVMLSTSGTELMLAAGGSAHGAYAACFRNVTAVARHLIGRHQRVAVIGAGSRGEFREEDQMGCAWLADVLAGAGYRAEDGATSQLMERWRGVPAIAIESGNSVAYLRRTDQLRDFEFTIGHVDDLDLVCVIEGNEVSPIAAPGSSDSEAQ
jgi:2-phosphosulfolactate phosphatase